MTIRKRLYISNVLMIITPVMLTLLTLAVLFLSFSELFGNEIYAHWKENERYSELYEDVEKVRDHWNENDSINDLSQRMTTVYSHHENPSLSLFIYDNQGNLVKKKGEYQLDPTLLKTMEGKQIIVIDNVLLQSLSFSQNKVIVVNQNYHLNLEEQILDNKHVVIAILIGSFFLAIVFVLLTNYILARFVFQPINQALDTLVYGVQQIRDGNLSWRISYEGKDEFVSVVDSFNEMALRLQRMVEEQERNTKNRQELIAGISHDLRTPLTAIKAYVEGLEKGVAQTPKMQQKYLGTIAKKTDDLNHLVSQLFLFSKLDVGEFPLQLERINIGQFLGTFYHEVREEYAERGLRIQLAASSYHTEIYGDKLQLRNVFVNILENTLKYGNQIDNQLEMVQYELNGKVVIEFNDNGPGVTEEEQSKLFEVFYRSDKSRTQPERGSGLGLAIAKKIIEKQEGQIQAKKSAKNGLQIEIRLPITEDLNE
ncbi:sensor histidine kinase [Enterococcus pallens]|uniref:histidine kinase n=1 Tax=Enterococcus pallens ATCC BAA-351 TaxID=1158607 RepID=R2Q9W0_9ENTE|nr:HAMP domain-containing sensor histidine kinase [Enterococcus pallens]EOH93227.1 hypothetical protein UAU_02870 [Enterococcus pallens ATCC BAA-351]EOU25013.1 hypothetical protein I588_01001 [Enterococcus pallens ATCC BAA-351]